MQPYYSCPFSPASSYADALTISLPQITNRQEFCYRPSRRVAWKEQGKDERGKSVCVREEEVDGEWVLPVLQLFIPFRQRFGSALGDIHSPFNHGHHFVPTFRAKTPRAFWIRVESSLPYTSICQIKCFSFGEVTAFNQINVVLYGTIK